MKNTKLICINEEYPGYNIFYVKEWGGHKGWNDKVEFLGYTKYKKREKDGVWIKKGLFRRIDKSFYEDSMSFDEFEKIYKFNHALFEF